MKYVPLSCNVLIFRYAASHHNSSVPKRTWISKWRFRRSVTEQAPPKELNEMRKTEISSDFQWLEMRITIWISLIFRKTHEMSSRKLRRVPGLRSEILNRLAKDGILTCKVRGKLLRSEVVSWFGEAFSYYFPRFHFIANHCLLIVMMINFMVLVDSNRMCFRKMSWNFSSQLEQITKTC